MLHSFKRPEDRPSAIVFGALSKSDTDERCSVISTLTHDDGAVYALRPHVPPLPLNVDERLRRIAQQAPPSGHQISLGFTF